MARCFHLKNCPVTDALLLVARARTIVDATHARADAAVTRCTCDELRADRVLARVRHRKGRVKFLADARIYLQESRGYGVDRDALALLRAAQVDATEVQ